MLMLLQTSKQVSRVDQDGRVGIKNIVPLPSPRELVVGLSSKRGACGMFFSTLVAETCVFVSKTLHSVYHLERYTTIFLAAKRFAPPLIVVRGR